MGLERLASVVQDVDSIFDVDTLKHCVITFAVLLIQSMEKMHRLIFPSVSSQTIHVL